MTTSPQPIPDPYSVLGLNRDKILAMNRNEADAAVKKAYRTRAGETHPDATKDGNAEPFQAIQAAYAALKTARLRRQEHLSQPLAGLQDGRVFDASGAFQGTFGGNFEPPKPTVSTKAKAKYATATRVVRPAAVILTEEDVVLLRIGLVLFAALTGVGIWQWPLPLNFLHAAVFIFGYLVTAPPVFWLGAAIVLAALLVIPYTSGATIETLKGTGKAVFVGCKLAVLLVKWGYVTTLRVRHWLELKRSARHYAP